jgi:hypothetical protein
MEIGGAAILVRSSQTALTVNLLRLEILGSIQSPPTDVHSTTGRAVSIHPASTPHTSGKTSYVTPPLPLHLTHYGFALNSQLRPVQTDFGRWTVLADFAFVASVLETIRTA